MLLLIILSLPTYWSQQQDIQLNCMKLLLYICFRYFIFLNWKQAKKNQDYCLDCYYLFSVRIVVESEESQGGFESALPSFYWVV
jgi:hypothetical protein